jgi:hypothetical protein
MVSPDIPDSMQFGWTFRGTSNSDYQTKFTVTLYDINSVVLKTYTKTTREMFFDLSELNYVFTKDIKYYWQVTTYNKDGLVSDPSVKAAFYYSDCPASPTVTWTYIPKQGEVIVKDTYFAEFKNNLLNILGDYEDVPLTLTAGVNMLFVGEVVPSRRDFNTLNNVVNYLEQTLEQASGDIDIYGLVSDSLGISDLEKIRNYIDGILGIAPKPVQSIDITTDTPDMYQMNSVTATSDGKEDTSISISWTNGSLGNQSGRLVFTELSPSKDIRYYLADFAYGPGGAFASELYFKESELTNGDYRTFDMDWDGLYDADNLSEAQHVLKVTAYDHRGNESTPKTKTVTYGSNFKIPMGVDHYEVQYQKNALTSTTYNANGTWSNVSTAVTTLATTHKVSGASGKFFYRVRAVDDTGLKTDWKYSGGVTFDPLKPPGVPKNLRVTQVGVTDATIDWDAVATAEDYTIHRYRYNYYGDSAHDGTNLGDTTSTVKHDTSLASNSIYNFFVRANNRAGSSDWACVNVHTDKPTHVKYYDSVHCHTWADSGVGWYSNQGVNHTYAYHGEWEGGGNTRGQWYFSYEDMRDDLKGAQITNVRMSIERIRGGYSTTAYKPKFYLHDRTTEMWSKNHGGVPPVLGAGATSNVSFVMGERKWVDLPNSYIEWIRDGKATGIMLHDPDGKPYMKFDTWAQIEVTYKK